MDALAAVAPGTALREGIDRILQANKGALIVVGDGPEVLNICSGGFLLDAAFSPQRLSELAKMDGAIILAGDASRIARANVHLVPNPNVPTSETGTRHRTAERVARSIDVPVVSVSEDMAIIAVYVGDEKHPLEAIPRLLVRANQALQTLERYRDRLDGVTASLSALEVEDLVTVRDVVNVLQRTEMVRRIADEIAADIVQLGVDGRLVKLQLEELMGGVEDDRRLVMLDYFTSEGDWKLDQAMDGAGRHGHRGAARRGGGGRSTLQLPGESADLDAGVQPRGYRLLARIPRLPESVVERIVDRFGIAPEDHAGHDRRPRRRDRRGRDPGAGHQGRPLAPGRVEHPRPLQLVVVEAELRRRVIGVGLRPTSIPCRSTGKPDRATAGGSGGASAPRTPRRRVRRRRAAQDAPGACTRGCGSGRARGGRTCGMRITLPSGTPAEIARPDGPADRGLVVIPDIGSLRPLFDDHVARLAAENGWVVCAFDVWGGRDDLSTLEARLAAGGALDDERVLGDAVAAADATGVEPVASWGSAWAGMYALKAAGTGRFARAVSFYGMGRVPEMWQGPTQGEPLDALDRPRRLPRARDRRHRRPVAAGRRPRRPGGRGRRGGAVRGRRPRLRPRPVAPGAPPGRRRRRLAPRHRPHRRRLTHRGPVAARFHRRSPEHDSEPCHPRGRTFLPVAAGRVPA